MSSTNPTEKEMLDMGNHFKILIQQKEDKIERLSKTILTCYGLARTIEEDPESAAILIGVMHQYLNIEVNNLLGIDN